MDKWFNKEFKKLMKEKKKSKKLTKKLLIKHYNKSQNELMAKEIEVQTYRNIITDWLDETIDFWEFKNQLMGLYHARNIISETINDWDKNAM